MKCTGPKAGDADLWSKIWEDFALSAFEEATEVEHVKAHRTMKETQHLSPFEKFIT